jgi:hypothetical protein
MTAPRTLFRTKLAEIAEQARATLPEANGRIDSAVKLVLSGDVELFPNGEATVASRSNPQKRYQVNGSCDCQDFPYAPSGWCAHKIARGMAIRLQRALQDEAAPDATAADVSQVPEPVSEPTDMAEELPELSETLRRGLVYIKGKPFIRFSALLAEAHARGLQKLEVTFISVTTELALAQATATFKSSGLSVTDVADATPGNVGAQVKAHYPRIAATRAAARALRNALNVGICSLDEIEH